MKYIGAVLAVSLLAFAIIVVATQSETTQRTIPSSSRTSASTRHAAASPPWSRVREPLAQIAAARPGTTIEISAGTYSSATPIVIPDGVTIKGEGTNSTWLKGDITFGSNQTISDLKLGDVGCSVQNRDGASTTTFLACRFRGGGGTGLDTCVIQMGNSERSCDHITFTDCNIERNLGTENGSFSLGYNNVGIQEGGGTAGGAHVEYITFDGCHFGVSNGVRSGCPRMDFEAFTDPVEGSSPAYALHGWENITVTNCVFEPSDWYNLDLADAAKADGSRASGPALISGCTFKGGGKYTICVESPKGVVIENNTIYRGGEHTFKMGCDDMSTVDPATVVRNNLFDLQTNYGIPLGATYFYLRGGDNRVTGNTIRSSAGGTVFTLDQARTNTITGNTLYVGSARLFTILAGSSGNVTAPNTVN